MIITWDTVFENDTKSNTVLIWYSFKVDLANSH